MSSDIDDDDNDSGCCGGAYDAEAYADEEAAEAKASSGSGKDATSEGDAYSGDIPAPEAAAGGAASVAIAAMAVFASCCSSSPLLSPSTFPSLLSICRESESLSFNDEADGGHFSSLSSFSVVAMVADSRPRFLVVACCLFVCFKTSRSSKNDSGRKVEVCFVDVVDFFFSYTVPACQVNDYL